MVTRWLWLALLVPLPVAAQGAVLTFVMEGTVDYVTDPAGLLPGLEAGQRAVYTYSFHSDAQDTSETPWIGIYQGISASLRVGPLEILAPLPLIEVYQPNSYQARSILEVASLTGSTYFRLFDDRNKAIASPLLPQTPFDLDPFTVKRFSLTLRGALVPPAEYPPELRLGGDIDAFYAIPEPGAGILAGLLLIMNTYRRKRMRRA